MLVSHSFDLIPVWVLLAAILSMIIMGYQAGLTNRRNPVATGLFILLLGSCAIQPKDSIPPIQIDGMAIENQTQMWVSAVRLLVAETGNFVSCGNIPPGSMCSTTFPESSYTGNPIEITWSQGGQIYSTGPFVLQLPEELDEGEAGRVRVVIAGPGSAGAVFIQN